MRNLGLEQELLRKYMREQAREDAAKRRMEEYLLRTLAADASHLPNVGTATSKFFYGPHQGSSVTATNWRSLSIPKTATFVSIMTIGGGAGGGGGLIGASLSARGGGGGGGSGAFGRGLFLAAFIPRLLFICPGGGGLGSASGTAGVGGGRSSVNDSPATLGTVANTLMVSGSIASIGGVAGTTAGGQAGGAAETLATNLLGAYMGTAISLVFIAGMAGTAAGALGGSGVALTYGAVGIPTTGGTGGGSTNTSNTVGNGGAITGAGTVQTVAGGVGLSAGPGGAGNDGIRLYGGSMKWVSIGGTGGGSVGTGATNANGGRGGDAGFGGGGGGCGSQFTGATQVGGAGGGGVVAVSWW